MHHMVIRIYTAADITKPPPSTRVGRKKDILRRGNLYVQCWMGVLDKILHNCKEGNLITILQLVDSHF